MRTVSCSASLVTSGMFDTRLRSPSASSVRSAASCGFGCSASRSTETETRRKPCTTEPCAGLSSGSHLPKSSCPGPSCTSVRSISTSPMRLFWKKPWSSSSCTTTLPSPNSSLESCSLKILVSSKYTEGVALNISVACIRFTVPALNCTLHIGFGRARVVPSRRKLVPFSCRTSIRCTLTWHGSRRRPFSSSFAAGGIDDATTPKSTPNGEARRASSSLGG